MKKILIADDENDLIDIIEEELKPLGLAQVFRANDGRTAFGIIQSERPDLVISDYNMPGLDGVELARKIIENKIQVPLIWITGQASPELFKKCWDLGVYDLIEKPFESQDLLSRVKFMLESDPKSLLTRRPGFTQNSGFSEVSVFLENALFSELTRRCQDEQVSFTGYLNKLLFKEFKS